MIKHKARLIKITNPRLGEPPISSGACHARIRYFSFFLSRCPNKNSFSGDFKKYVWLKIMCNEYLHIK
jgi:hypothetical protein